MHSLFLLVLRVMSSLSFALSLFPLSPFGSILINKSKEKICLCENKRKKNFIEKLFEMCMLRLALKSSCSNATSDYNVMHSYIMWFAVNSVYEFVHGSNA